MKQLDPKEDITCNLFLWHDNANDLVGAQTLKYQHPDFMEALYQPGNDDKKAKALKPIFLHEPLSALWYAERFGVDAELLQVIARSQYTFSDLMKERRNRETELMKIEKMIFDIIDQDGDLRPAVYYAFSVRKAPWPKLEQKLAEIHKFDEWESWLIKQYMKRYYPSKDWTKIPDTLRGLVLTATTWD